MSPLPPARRRRFAAAWVFALGLACAPDGPAPAVVEVPPVEEWPSPDPHRGVLERGREIGLALERQPAPLDELEFTDGRRALVTVLGEDAEGMDVLVEEDGVMRRERVAPAAIAALHRPTPEQEIERRLAYLVRVEAMVDGARAAPGQEPAPGVAGAVEAGPGAPSAARRGNRTRRWDLANVMSPADFPGATDVRWWPATPSADASSAMEAADALFDRTGVWAMVAERIGHGTSVGLQVTIEADRVAFEHSPGFGGAPLAELHGHWRLLVDGELRWEYFPDLSQDLEEGRFPYESASVTLGPGEHVVRWVLEGCDLDATYLWIIDSIRWSNVAQPGRVPTWGALRDDE